MTTELTPEIRYVKCPKCVQILQELPHMNIYQCGGCGTILQTKKHQIENQKRELQETSLPGDAEASTFRQETCLLNTGRPSLEKIKEDGCKREAENTHHGNEESSLPITHSNVDTRERNSMAASETQTSENNSSDAVSISNIEQLGILQQTESIEPVKPNDMSKSSATGIAENAEVNNQELCSEEPITSNQGHAIERNTNEAGNCNESSFHESNCSDELKASKICDPDCVESRNTSYRHDITNSNSTKTFQKCASSDGIHDQISEHPLQKSKSLRLVVPSDKVQRNDDIFSIPLYRNNPDTKFCSFDGKAQTRFQETSDSQGVYRFGSSSMHQRIDAYKFDDPEKKKLVGMVWEELRRLLNKRDNLKGKQKVFSDTEAFHSSNYRTLNRNRNWNFPKPHDFKRMAFTIEDENTKLQVDHICSHYCAHSSQKHSDQMNQKGRMEEREESTSFSGKKGMELYQTRVKRFILPLAGASPFITCQFCMKILQLPLDFLIFPKRHHRVKCGGCLKSVTYSVGKRGHMMIPPTQKRMKETDQAVSCSEDYGPSLVLSETASDKTPKPSPENSSEIEESKHSPLHRLMGYSSPTEVIKGHFRQKSLHRSASS